MRIKSPLRFVLAIAALILIIYIGFVSAASLSGGKDVKFAFWSKGETIKTKEAQNFVVAGVDEEGLRTDVILFCQYNDITKKLNVLQIPRDTKVDTKRSDKKINSAYGSKKGIDALFEEIGSITGITPDKYVIISFKAFRELVDAIGGVDVNVPFRMYYHDPVQNLTIDLMPGEQHLDGRHAEMYMRFRQNDDGTGYKNGDIERLEAQQKFYSIVADKLLNVKNVFKTHKLLKIFKENVKMNFTGDDVLSYIGKLSGFKKENFNVYKLPGEGMYIGNVSYFVHDKEETKKLMEENFSADGDKEVYRTVNPSKNRFIKVEIVNSSSIDSNIASAAEIVKKNLQEHGFNVVAAYNSNKIKDESEIVDHNAKNGAAELLKIYAGVKTSNDENPDNEADVTIYIGNDFTF